jgi:hypothetical protein
MNEHTFIKLDSVKMRTQYLGLPGDYVITELSADFLAVRIMPVEINSERAGVNIDLPLPPLRVHKGYSVVISPNPSLLEVGMAVGPYVVGYTGSAQNLQWYLKTNSKISVSLPWTLELRLLP